MDAAKCLGQTLRRYTGLNHLAQAARAVLQNSAQINQVSNLLGVDYRPILGSMCIIHLLVILHILFA